MGIKAIIRAINSFNFIPTKTFNNVIDGMIKETYDFLSSLKCADTNGDGMISIKEIQKVIVPQNAKVLFRISCYYSDKNTAQGLAAPT